MNEFQGLTLSELYVKIANMVNQGNINRNISARLDFPVDGRNKKYKIKDIIDGEIILYNDECNRPAGH